MADSSPWTVAIVGDGACAWMAAATLARRLPADRYRIVVARPVVHVADGLGEVEVALPSLAAFHAMLGLPEAAILQAANGAPSLGLALAGWQGEPAFLPFGAIGAPLGPVAFPQLAARLRAAGRPIRMANYAAAAIAAQSGRFQRTGRQPHGLHLAMHGYRAAMRSLAKRNGAVSVALDGVSREDDARLTLHLGEERILPLLVLDCTGPARQAIGAFAPRFERWDGCLGGRVDFSIVPEHLPPLYAQAIATDDGWNALIPLGTGSAKVRCRRDSGEGGGDAGCGRLTSPWTGNCVALGGAGAMVEPLHPIGLHLVQTALARLLTLFPTSPDARAEAAEYNRIAGNELDSVRDFVALHYATTRRSGPFWEAVRAAPLPERAAYKLALYAATGRVVMYDDEVFDAEDWAALFDAQGVRPRRHDALADAIPLDTIERHCARLREDAIAMVRAMPAYSARQPMALA